MAASAQHFVEFVEHDIAQEGRNRPPCGVTSFPGRTKPSSITLAVNGSVGLGDMALEACPDPPALSECTLRMQQKCHYVA